MDSFVLLTYASLAASRTPFQRLLACLNFTLDSDIALGRRTQKRLLWPNKAERFVRARMLADTKNSINISVFDQYIRNH